MKRLYSALCLLICFVFAFTCLAACSGSDGGDGEDEKPDKKSSAEKEDDASEEDRDEKEDDASASDPNGAETEAPEDETEAPAPEKVPRPGADGRLCEAYDLTFFVPYSMTPNSYNGMMGVYEYYTGEFAGSRPSGMDIMLNVSDESSANGDLAAYAKTRTKGHTGVEAEPQEVEINGATWLRCTAAEGRVNYYAIFNGGLYEIDTDVGGDTMENYNAACDMMLQTLFLAETE